MSQVDFLIVGTGLTGAVLARELVDRHFNVLLVDRRDHLGGNVHDRLHTSGIRIHSYGPHYFRTSSTRILDYVTRFAVFDHFEPVVFSQWQEHFERWPLSLDYLYAQAPPGWQPRCPDKPRNLEEAALAQMPEPVYRHFIRSYNEKQWGLSPKQLSADLAQRFDIRTTDDCRLISRARFQGLPRDGYASFMSNLLKAIPVQLNYEYSPVQPAIRPRYLLIYTGPIDAYFNYDLGKLQYRAQQRQNVHLRNVGTLLPSVQLNNPGHDTGPHIRMIEWKHLLPAEQRRRLSDSVVTLETPFSPSDPNQYEYPVPTERNRRLYQAYRHRVPWLERVLICGRLGEYRYYDMDQAIGRALTLAREVIRLARSYRHDRLPRRFQQLAS